MHLSIFFVPKHLSRSGRCWLEKKKKIKLCICISDQTQRNNTSKTTDYKRKSEGVFIHISDENKYITRFQLAGTGFANLKNVHGSIQKERAENVGQ